MLTKLGIHVNQGSRRGYGDVARSGPSAVVSLEAGAFDELPASTLKIWRTQTIHNHEDAPGDIDHISEERAYESAKGFWGPQLWERFQPVHERYENVYLQAINETGGRGDTPESIKSLRNVLAYERGLMEFFEAQGAKLALTGFAGDSPNWTPWVDSVVPNLQRGVQGGHIYCRHAYGGVPLGQPKNLTTPDGKPSTDNTARPFKEAQYLAQHGINIPIVIGEAGQNGGIGFAGTAECMADWENYDKLCLKPANYLIVAFCTWTYGDWMVHHPNIEDASGALANYLASREAYKLEVPAQSPTQPDLIVTPDPKDEKEPPPSAKLIAGINVGHSEELPKTAIADDGSAFPLLDQMQIGKFKVIRFMDWQKTNDSKVRRWEDLPTAESDGRWKFDKGNWDDYAGIPLEIIVNCANHYQARPWVCIPHKATAKLTKEIVKYVINNSHKRAIFEYSNEVWNSQFAQYDYAANKGGIDNDKTRSFIRHQATQTKKLIKAVGKKGDVVLSSQMAVPWITEQLLAEMGDVHPTAIAIGAYFGQKINWAKDENHLHEQITAFIDTVVLPNCREHKKWADSVNAELWSYEWGQHLSSDNFTQRLLYQSYNRSWRSRVAYQRFVRGWQQLGGGLLCAYSLYSKYKNDMWGLWEMIDGKPEVTPKWDGIFATPKGIFEDDLPASKAIVTDIERHIAEEMLNSWAFVKFVPPDEEKPALLAAILRDRMMPQSIDISIDINGEKWYAQAARQGFKPKDDVVIYAVKEGDWNNILRIQPNRIGVTRPSVPQKPPVDTIPPKSTKKFDLSQYLWGKSGHTHNLKSVHAGNENNETVGTIPQGKKQLFIKNNHFETFWVGKFNDGHGQRDFIYRGLDTSPGNGRFYSVFLDGKEGSPWCPRHMAVGESWQAPRPHKVQFYKLDNGQPSSENSGHWTNRVKFYRHHPTFTSAHNIQVKDVVEIGWEGAEHYFYAKGMGLVGWSREHHDPHTPKASGVSEIHSPNSRKLEPERVPNYSPPA